MSVAEAGGLMTYSRFSSDSAPGPSIMGFEDEVEQSVGRPCRQCDDRNCFRILGLTVPRTLPPGRGVIDPGELILGFRLKVSPEPISARRSGSPSPPFRQIRR